MNPSDPTPHHVVAYVESSRGEHPGHLVVGHESPVEKSRYFGYRFDPADLPPEFQDAARWREYLFSNVVPGHIVDETAYVQRILTAPSRTYFTKKKPALAALASVLPPERSWFRFAHYSFNPDDFPNHAARCYNCVTWGVETANRLVSDFLLPVRQGRVKLIIQQMERLPDRAEVDANE